MNWYYPWGYVAFELIPGIVTLIAGAIVLWHFFGKKKFADLKKKTGS